MPLARNMGPKERLISLTLATAQWDTQKLRMLTFTGDRTDILPSMWLRKSALPKKIHYRNSFCKLKNLPLTTEALIAS
jgi:hypothetical protein